MIDEQTPAALASPESPRSKDRPHQQSGVIQGHGAVVVVDRLSWRVEACSANLFRHLGLTPDALLGECLQDAAPALFQALEQARLVGQVRHLVPVTGCGGLAYSMLIHASAARLIVELEPNVDQEPSWWTEPERIRFIQDLAAATTIDALGQTLVERIDAIGHCDRVMLFRFDNDWHGRVVHEVRRPNVSSFLGLHFPASDLPPQARRHYEHNLQRLVCDTRAETVPMRYARDTVSPLQTGPLLLGSSQTEHIAYLDDLGVRGSFNVPLLVNGELWGMVACHSTAALSLSMRECLAIEEIARLTSVHLNTFLEVNKRERLAAKRSQLMALAAALNQHPDDPIRPVAEQLGPLLEMFGAGGAWLRLGGEERTCGDLPSVRVLDRLTPWLQGLPPGSLNVVNEFPLCSTDNPQLLAKTCGSLYIPLGTNGFLVLFRPERIQTVIWAGKSGHGGDERGEHGSGQSRAQRRCFSGWSEEVYGLAEAWDSVDTDTALELQNMLTQHLQTTRFRRDAHRDALTGLSNRRAFEQALQLQLKETPKRCFALHLIDLDRFKPINDTFGHGVGDAMLKIVASRLERLVRGSDMVARVGGDEFAILQLDVVDDSSVRQLGERIVKEVSQPYTVNRHLLEVGTSVGIARCPADAGTVERLLAQADSALYKVKEAGRNGCRFYSDDRSTLEQPQQNQDTLRHALAEEQFTLVFQPIFNVRAQVAVAFEALARWRHPQRGLLSTEAFLPGLEELQLLPAFGELMLDRVFLQQQRWQRQWGRPIPVFANIGAVQLLFTGLLDTLRRVEARYQTGFTWLCLDIHSQGLERNPEEACRRLEELGNLGARLYLDNFQYGALSLETLSQLSLSGIKASVLQVMQAGTPKKRKAMVRILKSLADLTGGELIMTHVESSATLEWLRALGIKRVQGYAVQAPQAPRHLRLGRAQPEGGQPASRAKAPAFNPMPFWAGPAELPSTQSQGS